MENTHEPTEPYPLVAEDICTPHVFCVILGLASALALKGENKEAIEFMEKGLAVSINEKQTATMRATLCFLYLKVGQEDKAYKLASELPHMRESREVIQPLMKKGLDESQIDENIRHIILGE